MSAWEPSCDEKKITQTSEQRPCAESGYSAESSDALDTTFIGTQPDPAPSRSSPLRRRSVIRHRGMSHGFTNTCDSEAGGSAKESGKIASSSQALTCMRTRGIYRCTVGNSVGPSTSVVSSSHAAVTGDHPPNTHHRPSPRGNNYHRSIRRHTKSRLEGKRGDQDCGMTFHSDVAVRY